MQYQQIDCMHKVAQENEKYCTIQKDIDIKDKHIKLSVDIHGKVNKNE